MYANEGHHWWFVARRKIIRRFLIKYFPHGAGEILEAGCGTGGNLELLEDFGSVHAMEMDEDARIMANSHNVCRVRNGKLPDNIPFTRSFNLICMFDVLEHVEDDSTALQAVKTKLYTNGKLLLTVPAYRFLWSSHDYAHQHKRRYGLGGLVHLVENSGFKIINATYFNTLLFPMVAAVRLTNNIFGFSGGSDAAMPSRVLNRLFLKIFSSERYLIPRFRLPFGVSILILAEKND